MSNYERSYGTDWDDLDAEEAIERAYALGVAASLGEYHPDELDAIRAGMDTAYERSVVDLAFDEGKTEGLAAESADESTADPWQELVEGKLVTVDPDNLPRGGRDGLPAAVDRIGALDLPERDSTDVVDLPEFLERD